MTTKRCTWVSVDNPAMVQYHDSEWGVPVHDDRKHFEFLVLEAAQAGLSWSIVLKKREAYRRAFSEFDPQKVARYTAKRIQKLISDATIIRNRMKIEAAVSNARAFLTIQEEAGSFDAYCWRFVDGRPKVNRWKSMRQIPSTSPESEAFSKDLKHRGFRFVGSTIVYAHMQAVGMVNDHLVDCFRYREIRSARRCSWLAPYMAELRAFPFDPRFIPAFLTARGLRCQGVVNCLILLFSLSPFPLASIESTL